MTDRGLRSALVTVFVAFVVVGCSSSTGSGGGASGNASAAIGPAGGVLEGEGARLTIPAGAVSQPVTFKIGVVANPPTLNAGTLVGKMIEIGPSGVKLSAPATLSLEWSPQSAPAGGDSKVTVYTAPSGGTANDFVPLETKVVDATHVSVQVDHFSDFGPILAHAVANTCKPGFCQQAGTECLYCEFPMCVPPGSKCCGASFCTPEAGACINCNGYPACGKC